MAISGITLSEKDLYYQWLINHNSASTMFNALSGNTGDAGSVSALSALSELASIGSQGISGISSLDGLSGIGTLSGLSGVAGTGSVSSFAKILEACLNRKSSGVLDLTQDTVSGMQAASMAEKLSEVLEEAAKTEDTSSLTYKTVKEIYDYFSGQVSGRAAELLGDKASLLRSSAQTGDSEKETSAVSTEAKKVSSEEEYYEQMDRMAIQGKEIDFSVYDDLVQNSFADQMATVSRF